MNLHIINVIIKREYLNRVKKKSFLITTFVVPVLFAALCVLPSVIITMAKEESKKVAVMDRSGIVMDFLKNNASVEYFHIEAGASEDSLKRNLESLGYDALLSISDIDIEGRTVNADVYSVKPMGVDLSSSMNDRINDAVEAYRIESYGIEDLETIMNDVKANVKLRSYTIGEDGKETISESGIFMIVSLLLGMAIYMFISLFGGMVMSSVIEEKASRVVEVLVSSVKAVELMFGKIIGVALVALTQFILWIVLTAAIVGVVSLVAGPSLLGGDPTAMMQGVNMSGMDAAQMEDMMNAATESGAMELLVSTLSTMPIGEIIACFIFFFIFGYLLYASIFAAIGSSVENEGDSAQLQLPVTIPLLLAFFIALYANKAPDSAIVFWGSMIPFTSPIVMLARLPFGVPAWEVGLSLVILAATVVLFAWMSAKVYKVGILMFGKKSTWKDLWKWFRQD